jgi:hypothetical protein
MELQTLYKLKTKFVAREVGNEMILVPLSGNVAQMNELFTLNETAKFIWENTNEKNTLTDIENLMTEQFDIDPETARKDIGQFMNRLEFTFHS